VVWSGVEWCGAVRSGVEWCGVVWRGAEGYGAFWESVGRCQIVPNRAGEVSSGVDECSKKRSCEAL